MDAKTITAQAIGLIAAGFIFASYQQRGRKRILILQVVSGALFTVHFLLLGAYPGAAMNLLGTLRSLVYSQADKRWAKSQVWLWVFLATFTAAGILTWAGPRSILPLIAMLLTTVSLWLRSPRLIRAVTFPSSPMWLAYNVIVRSYSGILTECFVTASITIAIIRYDIIERRRKAPGDDQTSSLQ